MGLLSTYKGMLYKKTTVGVTVELCSVSIPSLLMQWSHPNMFLCSSIFTRTPKIETQALIWWDFVPGTRFVRLWTRTILNVAGETIQFNFIRVLNHNKLFKYTSHDSGEKIVSFLRSRENSRPTSLQLKAYTLSIFTSRSRGDIAVVFWELAHTTD